MTEWFWLLIVAGGPLLLAVLIGYALLNRRKMSTGEKLAQRNAIRREYEGSDAPRDPTESPAARSFRQERAASGDKSELQEGLEDTFPASDPVAPTSTVTSGAPVDRGSDRQNARTAGAH